LDNFPGPTFLGLRIETYTLPLAMASAAVLPAAHVVLRRRWTASLSALVTTAYALAIGIFVPEAVHTAAAHRRSDVRSA
jgi:hypothetical protein